MQDDSVPNINILKFHKQELWRWWDVIASEMDIIAVKVIYLDKFLPEQSLGQSSVVGPVKEKILSNFSGSALWMIQKQLSKNQKISRKQSLSLLVLIFANPFSGQCCCLIVPENNLIIVKKSTKMQMRQKIFRGLKRVRRDVLIWMFNIRRFGCIWINIWPLM